MIIMISMEIHRVNVKLNDVGNSVTINGGDDNGDTSG